MTIIHHYSPKTHPIVLSSSKVYPTRRNLKFNYFFRGLSGQSGYAKTVVLSGALMILVVFFWLFIFSTNISLDYQISNLKREIEKKEDTINVLHEQISSFISDDKIEKWAKDNGFVSIKTMSYLNLSENNLAQAKSSQF